MGRGSLAFYRGTEPGEDPEEIDASQLSELGIEILGSIDPQEGANISNVTSPVPVCTKDKKVPIGVAARVHPGETLTSGGRAGRREGIPHALTYTAKGAR